MDDGDFMITFIIQTAPIFVQFIFESIVFDGPSVNCPRSE